eukprot:6922624-Prymnesium_polylepis.1
MCTFTLSLRTIAEPTGAMKVQLVIVPAVPSAPPTIRALPERVAGGCCAVYERRVDEAEDSGPHKNGTAAKVAAERVRQGEVDECQAPTVDVDEAYCYSVRRGRKHVIAGAGREVDVAQVEVAGAAHLETVGHELCVDRRTGTVAHQRQTDAVHSNSRAVQLEEAALGEMEQQAAPGSGVRHLCTQLVDGGECPHRD